MISSIMKWALAKVPRPLLIRLSYLVQWVAPVLFKGSKFIDPIDGRGYNRFFPYGYGPNQRENALMSREPIHWSVTVSYGSTLKTIRTS